MHGVSEVIAIILILMITISLAGLAYMFMSTTMSDVTASAGSTVDMTTSSMLTSFTIESIDVAKVYIRNTGQNALTTLSAYVNDEPATYNVTTPIAAGAVGTITIYSFIPDGATVKVTSPSGFSASKVAHPCDRAVGCWDFDEGSGTVAYDSSPNGNDGTLVNGPAWTDGMYGKGILLDGTNYVRVPYSQTLSNYSNGVTVCAWFKTKRVGVAQGVIAQNGPGYLNIWLNSNATYPRLRWETDGAQAILTNTQIYADTWYFSCGTYNTSSTSSNSKLYLNGILDVQGNLTFISGKTANITIGGWSTSTNLFNGTIDEVRIYDRAIY